MLKDYRSFLETLDKVVVQMQKRDKKFGFESLKATS